VDLTSIDPRGLERAAALVRRVLDREGNGPGHPFILGGFSQGAMVACEVAFNSDVPLTALVLLSAAYVDSTGWGWNAVKRHGLPVFIAHGRQDETFPFDQAERLAHALAQGRGAGRRGPDVTFVPFDGGHEVTAEVQAKLQLFLARLRDMDWRRSGSAGTRRASPTPSNVKELPRFPEGLPVCDPNASREVASLANLSRAVAPLVPGLDLIGKTVTVTGTLSLEERRGCTLRLCTGSDCCNDCGVRWQIVVTRDADATLGTVGTVALMRTLSLKECDPTPSTQVPVRATGILALDEGAMVPDEVRFSLEQANLCMLPPRR